MSDQLPKALKRRAARSLREREASLLDHFKLVREVQLGLLSDPSLSDVIGACETEGLVTDTRNGVTHVYGDDAEDGLVLVAVVVEHEGGLLMAPVE